jgi:hypothetical protein
MAWCADNIFIDLFDIRLTYGAPILILFPLFLLLMVPFLIFLVLLSELGVTVLLKPRVPLWRTTRGSTGIWGSIRGSTGIWGLPPTWRVAVWFRRTCSLVLCPGIVGGTVPLPLVLVVTQLLDSISVKAVIASCNLLPVFIEGFAAVDGFFKTSVNFSNASVALSVEAVVGMLYFSGRNTTVSYTLVPLVFGM